MRLADTHFKIGLMLGTLLGFVLVMVPSSMAVLYQYVDENGVVHVSTTPPDREVTGTAEEELEEFLPETELESRYKRFKEYIERYDVINIVTHEDKAVFATIHDQVSGVVDTYVPGTRLGEMVVESIKPASVKLFFEESTHRVSVRLKWENPNPGPDVKGFADDDDDEMALEDLAESMKPDFYVDDMREGKITAEVEAPSAAGSGGRITWALGSYTGPQSNTMEMLEFKKTLPDQILSLLQTSYEKSGLTFPEATGVTVEFAESEGFAFGDKMVAVDIQGEGQARLLILVEKALEEDSNSAVVLRGEMINLMIEWNKLLTKQPSWLRQIIRDVAKEQDRKSKVEEAVAAISIDEEIWGKNFENIIRGFDFIGKDEKFKTCDLVEVGMLQSFISLKGGYEAVRVVVDNLLEGKTYLQAFAIMAGEKRWQPFYSEFRDYAYRELLRMPDENSNVLFNVGRELLDKGDLEGARLKLQQSVKIDADNAEAQFLLGISYMRLRLFEQAQRYIQRALELDGGNPEYSRVFKELSDRLGGFEE